MTEKESECQISLALENNAEKTLNLEKPKKFPKVVFLIVFNEFCERFAYSGMKAFLALYLRQKLFYTDDEATEIYHAFSTLVYFFPIFGAMLADCYFGKYRTILYMMVVYGIGNLTIAITAIPTLGIPARTFTMIGLLLISLGTGGIKPCVAAFGGDQFILPEQEKQLTTFFSVYYFAISIGAFIAKTVSPILRSEIQCFGDKDCYSFAFGAPGLFILASIISFMIAKKMYIIKKPSGNIILEVMRCIASAIKLRVNSSNEKKKSHWLDYAREHYSEKFISDIKRTLSVFMLFAPLAVFWSLLDQLGSRWTLQATKMDGRFKFFTVRPDQMQVMVPILILIFIPIYKKIIYPTLEKFGIFTNSLHKLIAGCILAGFSFIGSGILEMHLETTYPILPSSGFGQLRIFNGYNCTIKLSDVTNEKSFTILPYELYEDKYIPVDNNIKTITYNKFVSCDNRSVNSIDKIYVEENQAVSYFYKYFNDSGEYFPYKYVDHIEKSRSGLPLIRIMTNSYDTKTLNITLYDSNKNVVEFNTTQSHTEITEIFSAKYELYVNSKLVLSDAYFQIGGVYTIMVAVEEEVIKANIITITEPNSISMAWILPQIIVISHAEILFAITGLEFAFKEAPESMKSVLQAYWLLVEAFGNIIIILVTRLASNCRMVYQFFFYAGLMFFATIIFYILTRKYDKGKEKQIESTLASYELVAQNDIL